MRVDAVITASNHSNTIADVAKVVACAPSITQTIIVDAGSTDDTAARAASVPATRVIKVEVGHSLGTYALIGASAASGADAIAFLDADLTGLTQAHVETLTWAVRSGDVGMACGLFDRGPFVNPIFLRLLPIVGTQRIVRRDVFDALDPENVKASSLEAALNSLCAGLRIPTHSVVLPQLRYEVDLLRGRPPLGLFREHIDMTRQLLAYASYMVSHRRPQPTTRQIAATVEAA